MSSNLPPGVTESMIPGNRPEDIAHDRILGDAKDLLPDRLERAVDILHRIQHYSDAEEFHDACIDFLNLFEPTPLEVKAGQKIRSHRTREWVLEKFMSDIENAAALAQSLFEELEPPEREYYDD